jgi:Zn-finger protein
MRSELLVAHEKLDSFHYWQCMLYPCRVTNKFLLTFETEPFFCACPVYYFVQASLPVDPTL